MYVCFTDSFQLMIGRDQTLKIRLGRWKHLNDSIYLFIYLKKNHEYTAVCHFVS